MGNKIYKIISILMLTSIFNMTSVFAENRLYMQPIEITQGEAATLIFSLDNDIPFYGFQADITLPAGLEFCSSDGMPEIARSSRMDATFNLVGNLLDNNILRLGAFSNLHSAITGNEGILFEVKVQSSDSFEGGEVLISDIYCVTQDNQDIVLPNFSTFISCIVPVKSIVLSQETASLKIGESITLSAEVMPYNAQDKTLKWSSSNDAVAHVDEYGNVTALTIGEAIITVMAGNVSASCKIEVLAVPVEQILLNISSIEVNLGESIQLYATIIPENATDKTITWSSSNESVATIDSNGLVTTISGGETIITAQCGSATNQCTIIVYDNSSSEDPGNDNPGNDNPGNDNPGNDNPGNDNPGNDNPGNDNPGNDNPGNDNTGNNNPGNDNPGNDNPGNDNPGNDNPGNDNPGNDNPGNDNPGNDNPGNDNPGNDNPGNDNPGNDNPGNDNPGNDNPGEDNPGNDNPGEDNPSDYIETIFGDSECSFDVYSINGIMILQNCQVSDLSKLQRGLYILRKGNFTKIIILKH